MKKKNLIILLIIPFLVSTLTIVSVNITYNLVDVDISYIEFDYGAVEAVKVGKTMRLEAKGVNKRNASVAKGNDLQWTSSDTDCAAISSEKGYYELSALQNGTVTVTCSNEKGNVSRSFSLIVYTNGAIIVSSAVPKSNYEKIDETEYFGEYDLTSGKKSAASFPISVQFLPENLKTANPVMQCSDNVSVDISFKNGNNGVFTGTAKINGTGEASIGVTTDLDQSKIDKIASYDFTIVNGGVNVYSYDDLLYCTNRSENGEIAVLHRSFESYEVYKNDKSGSSVCFGKPDSDGEFDFKVSNGTLYTFETKYNHEFLKQWNEVNPSDALAPTINVGLRVQKDLYGNGYQINFRNLAYPSESVTQDGVKIPTLGTDDVFRGPLPFYTVGKPGASGMYNLITAYGQDNIGLYIDGDNITVSNLKVQNCDGDDVQSLTFLDTVGTVVEVDGDNVTLKNMQMSNGRTVLRSFSSQNLLVDNCSLSYARNFLFSTGANEYDSVNDSVANNFSTPNGIITYKLSDFLVTDGVADTILTNYINGKIDNNYEYTKEQMSAVLKELQAALSSNIKRTYSESELYKGSTDLHNCYFYKSGITSVAFETLFNGPFLYSASLPGPIATFVSLVNSFVGSQEFSPHAISGTAFPVSVNVSGDTRFYDYKTLEEWDISGLVGENVSTIAKIFAPEMNYNIDQIFPIKSLLSEVSNIYTYSQEDGNYVNMPFAFYGGGYNYSKLTFNGYNEKSHISGGIDDNGIFNDNAYVKVDLLDRYLNLGEVNPSKLGQIGERLASYGIEVDQNTLIRTVTLVTGYEPFKFVFTKNDGYLYGEVPQIKEMQAVCKNALLMEAYNA